jgi:hypothetical protein
VVNLVHVAIAQTPEPEQSQDRVFLTDHAVIVLDGASAFMPVDVPTSKYVDSLGRNIAEGQNLAPSKDLADVVADAIRATARALELRPGNSPSSTVSILREANHHVDLYALGDGAIYYGTGAKTEEITDARLATLGVPEHKAYRARLAAGRGYDDEHRELLASLQRQQRERRNRTDGYWIAEADPQAAHQAITRAVPKGGIAWAVLATDGAYGPMRHLQLDDWPTVAQYDDGKLGDLLERCRRWETESDPNGGNLPRPKVSDDKTLAALLL